MQVNTLMPDTSYAADTLANSTPVVVHMANAPMPALLQLSSASTTRKIEVSADNQLTWEQPPPDISTTTKVVLRVIAPITHARFTGVVNDKYAIL